jgi:hypothetical protein
MTGGEKKFNYLGASDGIFIEKYSVVGLKFTRLVPPPSCYPPPGLFASAYVLSIGAGRNPGG